MTFLRRHTLLVALSAVLAPSTANAQSEWYFPYRQGVRLVDEALTLPPAEAREKLCLAIEKLSEASRLEPLSSQRKTVEGVFKEPYFPYYFRGIISFYLVDLHLGQGMDLDCSISLRGQPQGKSVKADLSRATQDFKTDFRRLPQFIKRRSNRYSCLAESLGYQIGLDPGESLVSALCHGEGSESVFPRAGEGLFEVVSFITPRVAHGDPLPRSVRIGWAAPSSGGNVRLQVRDLSPASQLEGELMVLSRRQDLIWDLESWFPDPAGITDYYRLGVVAWIQPSEESPVIGLTRTYLPVRVEVPGSVNHRMGDALTLIPKKDVTSVYLSLYDSTGEALGTMEFSPHTEHNSGNPLAISLEGLRDEDGRGAELRQSPEGYYLIELAGVLQSGGAQGQLIWFYHNPASLE